MRATLHLISAGLLGLCAGQFIEIANQRAAKGQSYDFEFVVLFCCITVAAWNFITAVRGEA